MQIYSSENQVGYCQVGTGWVGKGDCVGWGKAGKPGWIKGKSYMDRGVGAVLAYDSERGHALGSYLSWIEWHQIVKNSKGLFVVYFIPYFPSQEMSCFRKTAYFLISSTKHITLLPLFSVSLPIRRIYFLSKGFGDLGRKGRISASNYDSIPAAHMSGCWSFFQQPAKIQTFFPSVKNKINKIK